MRAKFSAPRSPEIVTLNRGDETVILELAPLPLGYTSWLHAQFPPPVEFVNGKPTKSDPPASYWRTLMYLRLAKALGDQLETPSPKGGTARSVWKQYARAIEGEFREAHLTEGDFMVLVRAMNAMEEGDGDGDVLQAAGND